MPLLLQHAKNSGLVREGLEAYYELKKNNRLRSGLRQQVHLFAFLAFAPFPDVLYCGQSAIVQWILPTHSSVHHTVEAHLPILMQISNAKVQAPKLHHS